MTGRIGAMSIDGTPISQADVARMEADEALHAEWQRKAVRVVAASAIDADDCRLLLSVLGLDHEVIAAARRAAAATPTAATPTAATPTAATPTEMAETADGVASGRATRDDSRPAARADQVTARKADDAKPARKRRAAATAAATAA
jgi:hypothetical protein